MRWKPCANLFNTGRIASGRVFSVLDPKQASDQEPLQEFLRAFQRFYHLTDCAQWRTAFCDWCTVILDSTKERQYVLQELFFKAIEQQRAVQNPLDILSVLPDTIDLSPVLLSKINEAHRVRDEVSEKRRGRGNRFGSRDDCGRFGYWSIARSPWFRRRALPIYLRTAEREPL